MKRVRIMRALRQSTQFTNAVIERRELAPTAIIRLALPSGELVPPMIDWPDDIASELGRHVYMVHGGRTYDGFPIAPLSDEEIDRVIDDIAAKGIGLVAVSGVFSPSDATQEEYVGRRIRQRLPDVRATLSHSIGRMGILERENAALLNASLLPLADRVEGNLLAAMTNLDDAVVVDIGGTTSDIGVLQDGFPRQSNIAIEVGGVRTNFRMPDIQAIGLGGGSLVSDDGLTIGPRSVGYRLVTEGLVFGGETLTATDIAVASGAADIGDNAGIAALDSDMVETAVGRIHDIIDDGVDQMKSSREPVPVILVGGGAVLVSRSLQTASALHRPKHAGVANAIGAANAQVGSEAERIVSYRQVPRETVLAEMTRELGEKLKRAGANEDSVRIADIEETAVSYMADDSTRIRVKMVGDLAFSQGGESR